MATTVGGSITGCSLAGRPFSVAGDTDAKKNLGGVENEIQANGDGTVALIQTIMPSDIGGLKVRIDENRRDQQYLADLQKKKDLWMLVLTLASGMRYRGKVQIVGKVEVSTKDQTAELQLQGEPLKLEQQ